MRQERTNIFYGIDWLLVILYMMLVGFGWLNIYAATWSVDDLGIFDISTHHGKQLFFIILCVPLTILILFLNTQFYERFSGAFYLLAILSLVGLFIFGKEINGAKSWYSFGGVSIQPSEFAKVFTSLALAKLLSDRTYNLKLIKNQVKAFFIIFLPASLIGIHDAGSALIFLSLFFVLNREGLSLAYTILGVTAIVLFILTILLGSLYVLIGVSLFIILFIIYNNYRNKLFLRFNWLRITLLIASLISYVITVEYAYTNVLKKHQKDRFEVLLGKTKDTKNIGYNTNQSLITISSGGLNGKGFLQGDRTQGNFVPEQHTDYIFSTVGEEWGFIGSTAVILVFLMLLYRIISLAETHQNKFGRIYGYGVASIIFVHLFINIGMVIGILPTIGIPLPFFSKGGSSLWAFTLLLFIFIKIDAQKKDEW